MRTSKGIAIPVAACIALVAVTLSYVALGLCLAQPLEDIRPGLMPLVNLGALAILAAVGISTFRFVFRKLRRTGG